ncbi:hypothetical protein [uncultured Variovorax sp.]|uniref:hypothetical protein n=1 Tax=uncultured Variovorax sp. TaxID=114708 RepID=UPI00263602CB|nr:hypothetical protein [uncultured Variovorax sp.]
MDGSGFQHLGKGLGVYAGAFFGVPMVVALWAGGFGWWSLAGWPASVAAGFVAGACLDEM